MTTGGAAALGGGGTPPGTESSSGGNEATGGFSASGSGGSLTTSGGAGRGGAAEGTGGEPQGGLGGASGTACEHLPLTSRSQWQASASSFAYEPPLNDAPDRAIDGAFTTRWSSGQAMSPDDWYEIDFGNLVALSRVNLHHAVGDHARGYEIFASEDPLTNEARPLLSGSNSAQILELSFEAPLVLRYLRIRQTGSSGNWWSLNEVSVICDD